jgi:hypothetical protein
MQQRQEAVLRLSALCLEPCSQGRGQKRLVLKYGLGNGEAPTGPENATEFTQSGLFIGYISEHRARRYDIEGCIGDAIQPVRWAL